MKGATVVAEILKREGVQCLIGYPVNHVLEAAAEADIHTIILRQERTDLALRWRSARDEAYGLLARTAARCPDWVPAVEWWRRRADR